MKKHSLFSEENFDVLKEVARDAFQDHLGLHAILRAQKHFTKRDSREDKFCESGYRNFHLTENEEVFHYIGFMDALFWLHQSNMLIEPKVGTDADIDDDLPEEMRWLEEETEKINTAISQFIKWAINMAKR